MTGIQQRGFHLYTEGIVATVAKEALQNHALPDVSPVFRGPRRIVVQERELAYSFAAHYHPYVGELARRLLRGSTKGLLAADTEYRLRVVLSEPAKGTLGGSVVPLEAGAELLVPDGAGILVAGQPARVAGRHLLLAAGKVLEATVGANVVVPVGVAVQRVKGASLRLVEQARAILVDAGPLPALHRSFFDGYSPDPAAVPDEPDSPHPVDELDFGVGGAYSVYNWELFFHAPMLIAVHLSRNGRYEEAMRWFHFIFDPTDSSDQLTPERFWQVKPFQTTDVEQIERILVNLSTGEDKALYRNTVDAINAWKKNPFRPHAVARFRPSAYMVKTVMAYLDNLIAWGDSCFSRDTGEDIAEALQFYVLAANILRARPQAVPPRGETAPQTYAGLRPDLDKYNNAMRYVEGSLLLDLAPAPGPDVADGRLVTIRNIGRTLYFGVPPNEQLLAYWDTVADRLFKIRNSLNLQGVFRQLPLFEPPIDPAMLARAAAAGLDVNAIINGLTQPPPHQRFAVLHQQAMAAAQSAAALGSALLSFTEKEDAEALALLRARQEGDLHKATEKVRYAQLQEALKQKEAAAAALSTAFYRYVYYEGQFGDTPDSSYANLPELDKDDLENLAAGYSFATEEMPPPLRPVHFDTSRELIAEAAGRMLTRFEADELGKRQTAREFAERVQQAQFAAAAVAPIPDFAVKVAPMGTGGDFSYGGSKLAAIAGFGAAIFTADVDRASYEAGITATVGGYWRREQEWAQQSRLASAEIFQSFKQLRASQLRVAIAEREWNNQKKQTEFAAEIEAFLNEAGTSPKGKSSNKALYTWARRETRGLYSRTLTFALELARKAEKAMEHELGLVGPPTVTLKNGYEAGKEGLLGGEGLILDLQRMQAAYDEANTRELEVTKHISLAQLAPRALLTLRTTGTCTFTVPEEWFDLDGPGHYNRRIRSVSLSIPAVTGPYTSINCRLELTKSEVRTDPLSDDLRDRGGAVTEIVASSGIDDYGVFDPTGVKDARVLPFEFAGAISTWSLTLPGHGENALRVFDYDSISDVILHMRFTAKHDGQREKNAKTRLRELLRGEKKEAEENLAVGPIGRVRLFSLRHEFPSEWASYLASDTAPSLVLTAAHFPYWSRDTWSGLTLKIVAAELFVPGDAPGDDVVALPGQPTPELDTPWTAHGLEPDTTDAWLAVTWTAD